MKITRNKNYILLGICGFLAVLSVVVTIGSATSGAQISNFQKKESVLSDQKRELEGELVKTLSVSQLQVKSSEMGFSKPAELVYLSEAAPVAKLP